MSSGKTVVLLLARYRSASIMASPDIAGESKTALIKRHLGKITDEGRKCGKRPGLCEGMITGPATGK
jgi:hypothetical protein